MSTRAVIVLLASLVCGGHARRVQQSAVRASPPPRYVLSATARRHRRPPIASDAYQSFTPDHHSENDPVAGAAHRWRRRSGLTEERALAWLLLSPDLAAGSEGGEVEDRSVMEPFDVYLEEKLSQSEAYAEKKLSKALERYESMIIGDPEVDFRVERSGVGQRGPRGVERQIAEITLYCKDNVVVHASAESDSRHASIDNLADILMRKLRDEKKKKRSKERAQANNFRFQDDLRGGMTTFSDLY